MITKASTTNSWQTGQPLTVTVNGREVVTLRSALADLVDDQGHGGAKVATAVNGEFVAASARAALLLKEGDRVEIVSARQGG